MPGEPMALETEHQMAQPKYSTPRDPSASTDGARISRIAQAIGKPFMPWQQHVVDVATEREESGAYRYEIVMVTVPRQSGKTTLVGPVQLDRVIMNPGIKVFYTAQTGKDARSRFNDLVKLVQASPLDAVAGYRFSAGDEALSFPNGSALKIFAPVEAALHGETPPLVTLDEVWEWDEALGDAILEGAIIPAQITLAGRRQVWMISTAGTALSTFMRKWVDRGRAGWPRMAYFEWGLPEGEDPYDRDAIAAFHPAVGETITVDDLISAAEALGEEGRATWLRAFCNVWTEATDPLMSADEWAALAGEQERPNRSSIAISYDVSLDGSAGVVMACWRDSNDRPNIRVLHAAPGTTWMLDFLVRLHKQWEPKVLGGDDGGPTRRITDELRRAIGDDKVQTTGARDFGTACEAFITYARDDGSLIHDGSPNLARGMAGLTLRRSGDSTRFSRSTSATPIAGLVASAVGLWLFDHVQHIGKPEIFSLGDF